MISLDDVTLLLRGWGDKKSLLRIVVQSPETTFSGFCTVWKADEGYVTFWIGEEHDNNMVAFLLRGCVFDFTDIPPEQAQIPVGATVESGIVGTRSRFMIAIMLLKAKDNG